MKDNASHPDTKPNPFDQLLTRQEYADRFGITYRTAEMQAHKGIGPRVTRLGRRAYYHLDDIQAWIDDSRAKAAERFERKEAAR